MDPVVGGHADWGLHVQENPAAQEARPTVSGSLQALQAGLPVSLAVGPSPACCQEPLTPTYGIHRSKNGDVALSPGWLPTPRATLAVPPACPGPVLAVGMLLWDCPYMEGTPAKLAETKGCHSGRETMHVIYKPAGALESNSSCSSRG